MPLVYNEYFILFRSKSAVSMIKGKQSHVGISIRALWEQMEELIDLLDQVK